MNAIGCFGSDVFMESLLGEANVLGLWICMTALTRDEALALVKKHVTKRNVIFHMLSVEVIMRRAAEHFGEDPETWGLVGLLHDVDYEKTETTPEKHSLMAEEILKGIVPDEAIRAIKAHNAAHTGISAETQDRKSVV
jgi:putative nucleotidyltransferase with HDIG domain